MFKRTFSFVILFLTIFGITFLTADEGMYTPDRLRDLDLYKKGLIMKISDIFDPGGDGLQEAVLLFGGGTSEFISSKGLILTNHHVAYSSVQSISTVEKNYLHDGFLAKTYEEERQPNRPITGRILKIYKNVTDKILDDVQDKMPENVRQNKINENTEKLLEKERSKKPDLEINVVPFYSGNEYYLIGYFIIRDFRMVYVPPVGIGEYGGDIDNWMWPRHTGDFSFMRAYVSKDGKGVPYSQDNVPYEPKTWLEIETGGIKKGDFVFALGYPGTTYRFQTSFFIENQMLSFLPFIVDVIEGRARVIEEEGAKDPAVKLEQANLYKGLMNAHKNFAGNLEWYQKVDLLPIKKKIERQFQAYVEMEKDTKEKFGSVLNDIEKLYETRKTIEPLDYATRSLRYSALVSNALYLYNYSIEKEKPEAERGNAYKGQGLENQKRRLAGSPAGLFMPLEKDNFYRGLLRAAKLSGNDKISAVDELMNDAYGSSIEDKAGEIVKKAYENTILTDPDKVSGAFDMSTSELLGTGDVFIKIAADIAAKDEQIQEFNRNFRSELAVLNRHFTEGMMIFKKARGHDLYPDANRTFRFSYGYVKGYKPRDAVYYPFYSTLTGVMEKDQGEYPFEVPERLKEIYEKKDFGRWADPEFNDVVVDFMCDADGTGGSSGSPVLNAEGRLIGCLFDGNWEAITNDYMFMPELTREICVDIRYALLVLEKFGAEYLLDEMGVNR